MNRKIIYVDFIFKRKKISSKFLFFIYDLKLKSKNIFNGLSYFKFIHKNKFNNIDSSNDKKYEVYYKKFKI